LEINNWIRSVGGFEGRPSVCPDLLEVSLNP